MTPHAALRAVAPSTGWSDELLRRVSFNGGADPILPTPLRIGAAGAAAIAASGLAAADLWKQRSGRPQDVAVDLRQATAALRSGPVHVLGEWTLPDERSPIMGVYPTGTGTGLIFIRPSRTILRQRSRFSAAREIASRLPRRSQ